MTADAFLCPYDLAKRAFAAGRLSALAHRDARACPFPADARPQQNSWRDGYAMGWVERLIAGDEA